MAETDDDRDARDKYATGADRCVNQWPGLWTEVKERAAPSLRSQAPL